MGSTWGQNKTYLDKLIRNYNHDNYLTTTRERFLVGTVLSVGNKHQQPHLCRLVRFFTLWKQHRFRCSSSFFQCDWFTLLPHLGSCFFRRVTLQRRSLPASSIPLLNRSILLHGSSVGTFLPFRNASLDLCCIFCTCIRCYRSILNLPHRTWFLL